MIQIFLLLCALLLSAWSHGGNGGSSGGGLCPFGVSGDGCTINQTESTSGFVATGPPISNIDTIQHSNFFTGTYARQSGQTWGNNGGSSCVNPNCHPPWNVAGVDYPVGIQSTFATTLCGSTSPTTLCDPTTATLPTGCTYCPANTLSTPCPAGIDRQEVTCLGQASYDIEGYNFAVTAQGCVALDIWSASGGGTLTVKNNKWGNTVGCYSPTHHNFSTILNQIGNSFANVLVAYNYSDGNGQDVTANNDYLFTLDMNGGTNIVIVYNALFSSVANPINAASQVNGTVIILYNFMEGMPCKNGAHCHYISMGGLGVNLNSVNTGYNTILVDNGDLGGTAIDWTDLVAPAATITTSNQYNNVIVNNTLGSSVPFCGGQCFFLASILSETGNTTNMNIKNNYFDSTGWGGGAGGVNQCIEWGSGTNQPGTIANTSPTISSITTTNFLTNMFLFAAIGIPANTTASTIGANSITMSANATANTTETIYGADNPFPTFTLSGNVNMLTGKSVNSLTQDLTNGVFNSSTVGGAC